jgi:2-keto-4-pentenoate hydratase/2-oxohepta-3-ene-1,7-dioic acid hydratase in catechol pathway
MSTSVLRTADAWWALTADGTAARVRTDAMTTGDLIVDRAAVDAAAAGPGSTPVETLDLVSPVTAPCRVVAQMTNYVSHVEDSGMNPDTVPLTFFRKTSGSISGPTDDIVRPAHVRFLDYEIELGLVVGEPLVVGDTVTSSSWTRHVAGLVITNDVSARDVQLPKTQFFESKSYPTFTPVGPVLLLLDDAELRRFPELRLRLTVNGQVRQDSTCLDMIYSPEQALAALAKFQRLDTGDLLVTGTPGGTALKAPPRPIEMIGALLPPALKWKKFFESQAKNTKYLQDGDRLELTIATPDGALDLGVQTTTVRHA